MEISERKRRILHAVVEHYIQTAEPVGSRAVMEIIGKAVSSATIRNEMAELEAHGLLEQPHTSAGRVPSARGYRLYVNELMQEHKLSMAETERINEALRLKMVELDRVIDEAGRIASRLTTYPAFSLTAGRARVTIRRFDLLMVENNAFIVVLLTDSKVVRNKLFRLPSDLNEQQLALLNTLLNTSFAGLTLAQMTPELMRMAATAAGQAYGLLSLVVSFAMEVLEEQEQRLVHTAGLTNLLSHPEYRSMDRAQPLLEFLEQNDPNFLSLVGQEQTKILIGPENVAEALKETSVVLASYDIGDDMRGIIGVVGPTRMDYAKIAARLNYFAEGLSRLFGQAGLPEQKEE